MRDKLREYLEKNFGDALIREDDFRDQQSFYIKKDFFLDICRALLNHDEFQVKFLSDICALDWFGDREEKDGRFEVIYNLFSLKFKYRFFLKVRLDGEDPEIDSLSDLWHCADWLEREVYDLFGIVFIGHPNLVKIVTPGELQGYPLRKDFPLTYEIPQFSYNKDEPPEVLQ
nr:NADH-quinone oxidoreductase subunit C [candidate division Zixibacteria bacterium]